MSAPGTLYVAGTPIGHLGDVSDRLREVLASVDVIACEDTRTTRKLLSRFQITRPRLVALPSHDEARRSAALIERLAAGDDLALVSEAGMPVVSDPGAHLIGEARALGAPIVVVPGPSAVTAALAVSGFPGGRFHFLGFLPRKGRERRSLLSAAAGWPGTLVLFEAPGRLRSTLADLSEALGADREAMIARELTKRFETLRWGTLGELQGGLEARVRGEVTLVVAPAPRGEQAGEAASVEAALEEVAARVGAGERAKDACRAVAEGSARSVRDLYQAWLAQRAGLDDTT